MPANSHLKQCTIMILSSDFDARLIHCYLGMRLTTGFGPNVLLVEPKRATFPVLLFIPLPLQQTNTTRHAETSTIASVPGPASFSINAVNASQQDIIKDNSEDNNVIICHSQLNPTTFKPVTPINPNRFEELLKGHPNRDLVQYVITSFR